MKTSVTSRSVLDLHCPRSVAELLEVIAEVMGDLLPGVEGWIEFDLAADSMAPSAGQRRVRFGGARSGGEAPGATDGVSTELEYRGEVIGRFVPDPRCVIPLSRGDLDALLGHITTAFANLWLNERAAAETDVYDASLRAIEESIELFHELNPDVASARMLSRFAAIFDSPAAAMFMNHRSMAVPPALVSVFGVHESGVQGLRAIGGDSIASALDMDGVTVFRKDEDGQFAELEPGSVPAVLHNIIFVPLRDDTRTFGMVLVFNGVGADTDDAPRLQTAQRLGGLGASVFRRLELEAEALRSRELHTQLEIAASIQARLLPDRPPDNERYECAWRSQAAQFVGGDCFDVVETDDGRVAAVIADVSGHGVDSALLMGSFRASFRAECLRVPPSELLTRLNHAVTREVGDTGKFITAAVFEFAADGTSLRYASAGHNDIYVWRQATATFDSLESTGTMLGCFLGFDFEEESVELARGDIVLLYTDGIVEAMCPRKSEMYGDDRMLDIVREHAAANMDSLVGGIVESVADFTGLTRFEDDVTVAALRCC